MVTESIEPKRPKSGSWRLVGHPTIGAHGETAEAYDPTVGAIRVLSSIDLIEQPDGRKRYEFHVSVTRQAYDPKRNAIVPKRANWEQVRQALLDFDMKEAVEDNHLPTGKARQFWLPVETHEDPRCPCETTEEPHDEGDGYVWREVPEKDGEGVAR